MNAAPQLCIFIPEWDNGGVERMMANLTRGLASHGISVDLLQYSHSNHYLTDLPPGVRRIHLGAKDRRQLIATTSQYLLECRPEALLSAKDTSHSLAVTAKQKAGVDTRIYLSFASNISQKYAHRNSFKWLLIKRELRRNCHLADGLLAVSQGVADDIHHLTHLPTQALPNPVITSEVFRLAKQPPEHPWLAQPEKPVILGAGRLGRAKNFSLLIDAFALLRKKRPCRLIIFGEGRQRARLQRQAETLGIAEDFSLPGYTDNPYSCLANANLFVLSSRWEGSPTILLEALAVGCPAVATDCPSGPREILANGRFGQLVAMDNAKVLSDAMNAALDAPLPAELLKQATAAYTVDASTQAYIEAMKLKPREP